MTRYVAVVQVRGPEHHTWACPEGGVFPPIEVGSPGRYEIRARLEAEGAPGRMYAPWSVWQPIEVGAEIKIIAPNDDAPTRGTEMSLGRLTLANAPPPPRPPALGWDDFAELRDRLKQQEG